MEWISGRQGQPQRSAPSPPQGRMGRAPEMASETLFLWLVHGDGTLATTIQRVGPMRAAGYGREVSIALPALGHVLAMTQATDLFMAHNHPSGDPRPSQADIDATRQIWRLARTLGASLQDHLIIGGQSLFSFRANGLL